MSESGFELGRAFVAVDPDVSDFAQQLDEELGGLTLKVRVTPDVADFAGAVDEELGGVSATVRVDADTAPAREQVDELVDTGMPRDVSIDVQADTGSAVSSLQEVAAAEDEVTAATGKLAAGAHAAADALASLGAGGAAGETLSAGAEEVRAFGQEFSLVDTEIREFESTVKGMSPELDSLKASFSALGTDFKSIQQGGTIAAAELVTLRAQLGQVTSELDTLEGAFGTTSSAMSEMGGEARSAAEGLDGVASAMEQARSAGATDMYAGVAEQLGFVTERSQAAAQAQDQMAAAVDHSAQQVELLVSEMNDLRDLPGFGGIIAAMPELQQLDDRIIALREDVASMQEPGAATAASLAELDSRIASTGEALSAVESVIPTFSDDIATFEARTRAAGEANTAAQEAFTGLGEGAAGAAGEVATAGEEAGKASGLVDMLGGSLTRYGADPFMWMYLGPQLAGPALEMLTKGIEGAVSGVGSLDDALHQQYQATGDNIAGYQNLSQALDSAKGHQDAVTASMSRTGSAADDVHLGIDSYGQAIQQVSAIQQQVSQQAQNLAGNLGALGDRYGISAGQAETLAQASGASTQALADGGSAAQQAMARVQAFGDANEGARGSVNEMSNDMLTFGNSALSVKDRVAAVGDSFGLMVGNLAGADAAVTQAKAGLLSIKQAADTAGASMSGTNQASLSLQSAFYGQIQQDQSVVQSMIQAGDSTQQVTGFIGDQTDSLDKYVGHSRQAQQALDAFRQYEERAQVAAEGLTGKVQQASQELQSQFSVEVTDAGVKSGTATRDVHDLAQSIENTGTTSNATHDARQKMIHDLEESGMQANKAKQLVDYYIHKLGQIPKDVLTHIKVTGSGYWSVSGGGIYPTPSGGNTTAPIGTITPPMPKAAGGLITGGTPGKDSVLLLGEPGEVMVPTHMVKAGAVDHLRGKLPGFSGGGVVGSYSGPLAGVAPWATNEIAAVNQQIIQAVAAAMTGAISQDEAAARSQMSHRGGNTVIQNYYGTQYPSPEQKQAMLLSLSAAIGTS